MSQGNTVIILRELLKDPQQTQRNLAATCGMSLGTINRMIQRALDQHYLLRLDDGLRVTDEGLVFLEPYKVKNAIVLAAGFTSSALGTVDEIPGGFLKVKGEIMIERQIEQLQDRGIFDITLVVGYQMEAYDYLVDRYGVTLVYNPDFATINNYASLYHAADKLDNTYILVADTYIEKNFFNLYEATSWYCCVYCEGDTNDWCVSTSPMGWIKNIRVGGKDSLTVVGPAYLNREMSERLKILLNDYYGRGEATHYYWEEILKENFNDFQMKANVQTGYVYEFNHLDQVRHYDESHYDDLKREIIAHFPSAAPLLVEDIESIELLEDEWDSEMYRFDVREDAYVIRIPGEEEVSLYDHASVKHVYDILAPLEVAEELLDSDVSSGVRITRFADESHYVDPMNDRDLSDSMQLIRQIHDRKLRIDRHYDIRRMFSLYETLVEQTGDVPFRDIEEMKRKMGRLLFLKAHLNVDPVLCHGDYLYANVIRKKTGGLFITNWEFSGMSDPLMDVAMFGIDANFDPERLHLALRLYLGRDPDEQEIVRLHLYAALGGMLWSMWGLHKKRHGLDLGDYPVRMYRFMKDYYRLLEDLEPSLATGV